MLEWVGGSFDPDAFDASQFGHQMNLARLAGRTSTATSVGSMKIAVDLNSGHLLGRGDARVAL